MRAGTTSKKIFQPANGKSAEGRGRILKAAKALFIKQGYDGVSVNDIATCAQVAKALVFYHFNSKQELFEAVLDHYYRAQAKALMSAIDKNGTIRERVHAGIDAYLDFMQQNPGYPRLIQGEICSNSRNLNKILEHMEPLYLWGNAVFGSMLPSEGSLSPRHFFISIFGMIVSYFTYMPVLKRLWKSDPLKKQITEERREHLHLIINALLDKFLEE